MLKEKDVQANSLHNVPRAVACGVLWGVRRADARGRAGGGFVHPVLL